MALEALDAPMLSNILILKTHSLYCQKKLLGMAMAVGMPSLCNLSVTLYHQQINKIRSTTPCSMTEIKIPFGERKGRLIHISEVQPGLSCQCTCSMCGHPLVARKGIINAHHFAHYAQTSCAPSSETLLHRFAKELLSEQNELLLPKYRQSASIRSSVGYLHAECTIEAKLVRVISATTEVILDGVIPDVLAKTDESALALEVAVSHFCDQEKVQRMVSMGLGTIEFNLSDIDPWIPVDTIRNELLTNLERRRWLVHPMQQELGAQLDAELQGQLEEALRRHVEIEWDSNIEDELEKLRDAEWERIEDTRYLQIVAREEGERHRAEREADLLRRREDVERQHQAFVDNRRHVAETEWPGREVIESKNGDIWVDGVPIANSKKPTKLLKLATQAMAQVAIRILPQLRVLNTKEQTTYYRSLSPAEKVALNCSLMGRSPEYLPPHVMRAIVGQSAFQCHPVVWQTGIYLKWLEGNGRDFTLGDVVDWCATAFPLSQGAFQSRPIHMGLTWLETAVLYFLEACEHDGWVTSDHKRFPRHRTFSPVN